MHGVLVTFNATLQRHGGVPARLMGSLYGVTHTRSLPVWAWWPLQRFLIDLSHGHETP